MPDMLVRLYDLPRDTGPEFPEGSEIVIRRAIAPEKDIVTDWVGRVFPGWRSEVDVSFGNHPVSCYIAVENGKLLGFACYDSTCKNFFGPTGVDENERGRGIGKALLMACLQAMRADGYAYAVIGAAGPVDFYRKAVGATEIEGSVPGIYRGMLQPGEPLRGGK